VAARLLKPQNSLLLRLTGAISRTANKQFYGICVRWVDRACAADAQQNTVKLLGSEAPVPWIFEQVEHGQRPGYGRREVATVALATGLDENFSRGVRPGVQPHLTGALIRCLLAAGSSK
jgi:hypothetical protein